MSSILCWSCKAIPLANYAHDVWDPLHLHPALLAHIYSLLWLLSAAQYDDSPEALEEALDTLLEDPEFLDAVADEVMFKEYEDNMGDMNADLDKLRNELMAGESKGGQEGEGK